MMIPPPGINGPAGRGFPPVPMPQPSFSQPTTDQFGLGQGYPVAKDSPLPTHARQASIGFEGAFPAHPIGRPAPIGRPGSMSQTRSEDDSDDETTHLGSRALIDEDDDPLPLDITSGSLPRSLLTQPPGPRGGFGASPFMEPVYPSAHSLWGPSAGSTNAFPPPGFGNPGWGSSSVPPGFGVGSPVSGLSSIRAPTQSRHVTVRQMLCQACQILAGITDYDGFIDMTEVKEVIDAHAGDALITTKDLLDLCDTEGSPSNGGGTFDVRYKDGNPDKMQIKWVPDPTPSDGQTRQYRAVGAPGEIGSPLAGQASLRGI